MSSLNLKQRVKEGKLSPSDAFELLIANADDAEQARDSRTARWLCSPNARKRFEQARKS